MNFVDLIKKSVLSEFSGSISAGDIVFSLVTAFVISIYIIYIYKKTYSGVVFSKTFALCLMLLCLVTALIIRTISSNLALSLGMVGALSIVRFRTAVKEPVDTGFMFWAIAAGIMAGTGYYLIALIGSITLGLLFFIGYTFGFKSCTHYLFVIKYDSKIEDVIKKNLKEINYKLKSKSINKDVVELTFEIAVKDNNTKIVDDFKDIEGVISTTLINYQNDFGA